MHLRINDAGQDGQSACINDLRRIGTGIDTNGGKAAILNGDIGLLTTAYRRQRSVFNQKVERFTHLYLSYPIARPALSFVRLIRDYS